MYGARKNALDVIRDLSPAGKKQIVTLKEGILLNILKVRKLTAKNYGN